MNQKIPNAALKWFNQTIEQNLEAAKKGSDRKMIIWKMEHTERVIKWGEKIMEKEKGVNWNKDQGLVVCLLHDIGRFPQALYGTFLDHKSISHAKLGKKMFDETNIDCESFGGDKEIISEAIGEHNNPYYQGENIYAKLARDADQLAIFEELDWQTKSNEFRKTAGISQKMKDEFMGDKVINSLGVESIAEWMVCVMTWKRIFNFESTKKLYQQENYDKKLVEKYLEIVGKDDFYLECLDGNAISRTSSQPTITV